jgi:hypothetical protein
MSYRSLVLVVLLALWPLSVRAEERDPLRIVAQETAACLSGHTFRSLNGPAWVEARPQGYRVAWRPIEPDATGVLYEWIDVRMLEDGHVGALDPMTERWWPTLRGVVYAVHGGSWDPQLAWTAFECMDDSLHS